MRLSQISKLEEILRTSHLGGLPESFFVPTILDLIFNRNAKNILRDEFFISKALITVFNFLLKAELAFFSSYEDQGAALREWKKQKDEDVFNHFNQLVKGRKNKFWEKNLHLDAHCEYLFLFWLDTEPIKLSDYDLEDPRWAELTFDEDWYRDPDKGTWNVGKWF